MPRFNTHTHIHTHTHTHTHTHLKRSHLNIYTNTARHTWPNGSTPGHTKRVRLWNVSVLNSSKHQTDVLTKTLTYYINERLI
ncbi:hypothetical protein LSH36_657g00010 [Paralvinella palmiformis]|uniref:Uncharacterized protein n=1 Tax=Paralvinella palmiformis TaxID=53620 RepID=A0AAD9J3Q0_9ANNE|nr:hypothetical protein LSH36_657g00010 [Paralvinella palmiformis]